MASIEISARCYLLDWCVSQWRRIAFTLYGEGYPILLSQYVNALISRPSRDLYLFIRELAKLVGDEVFKSVSIHIFDQHWCIALIVLIIGCFHHRRQLLFGY